MSDHEERAALARLDKAQDAWDAHLDHSFVSMHDNREPPVVDSDLERELRRELEEAQAEVDRLRFPTCPEHGTMLERRSLPGDQRESATSATGDALVCPTPGCEYRIEP
ncbi:hypothetical protein GCM10027053_03820 [Intrasporangium mesophilum]